MSEPPVTEEDLHAWNDRRLDAAGRHRVEAWLARHPAEARRLADWRAQDEALHRAFDPLLQEPIPARLSRQLQAPARRWPLALAASLACALLGGLAGWQLGYRAAATPGAPLADFPRQAAVAHAVYVPEQRHPVEVGADQQAHLVAWLSKRLGAPLQVPDLSAQGYQLVGGRLLPGRHGPGAQFMFERPGGGRLTLYLSDGTAASGETAFRYAQEDGISVFYWVDGPFAYALSGQISRAELLALAEASYRQLRP